MKNFLIKYLIRAGLLFAIAVACCFGPIPGLIAIVIGLVYWFVTMKTNCDVCGNALKRKTHYWTIEGKEMALCPYCNQKLSRQKSDAGLAKLKGN